MAVGWAGCSLAVGPPSTLPSFKNLLFERCFVRFVPLAGVGECLVLVSGKRIEGRCLGRMNLRRDVEQKTAGYNGD